MIYPINIHVIYKIVLMKLITGTIPGYQHVPYEKWIESSWKSLRSYLWKSSMKIHVNPNENPRSRPWKTMISCRGNQCEILVFVFSQAGGKKAHFVDLPRLDTKWNLIVKPWKKRAWGNPIIPCSDFFSAPYAHGFLAPEVWGIEYTQNKPQKLQLKDLF